MKKNEPITIYTLQGFAETQKVSYGYLRLVLLKYQKGEISEFKGYKFFGGYNKAWFAYPADMEINLIDATEEFKAAEKQKSVKRSTSRNQ